MLSATVSWREMTGGELFEAPDTFLFSNDGSVRHTDQMGERKDESDLSIVAPGFDRNQSRVGEDSPREPE